jgi:hypothetical protein
VYKERLWCVTMVVFSVTQLNHRTTVYTVERCGGRCVWGGAGSRPGLDFSSYGVGGDCSDKHFEGGDLGGRGGRWRSGI